MDAVEAIRTRGMRPRVSEKRPERAEIEELLELAARAPNHHMTEPWRFYVLAGDERQRLARAIADEQIDRGVDRDEAVADGEKKVARAPVIVVFTAVPSDREDVVGTEELASVAMAIENFLVGAHARGLGAMLRTGPAAYHPVVRKHLGLADDESVVGFVYLGYPERDRALTERTPAGDLTTWLGWDG